MKPLHVPGPTDGAAPNSLFIPQFRYSLNKATHLRASVRMQESGKSAVELYFIIERWKYELCTDSTFRCAKGENISSIEAQHR